MVTSTADVTPLNSLGMPNRMIDVVEAQRVSPLIEPDGLLAAAFSPTDGRTTV